MQYLKAVTDLLVDDLQEMVDNWKAGGVARKVVEEDPQGPDRHDDGAGQPVVWRTGGRAHEAGADAARSEEEHDWLSDNTHNSHYYNQIGIRNVYLGNYARIDGKTVSGQACRIWVKAKGCQAGCRGKGPSWMPRSRPWKR